MDSRGQSENKLYMWTNKSETVKIASGMLYAHGY